MVVLSTAPCRYRRELSRREQRNADMLVLLLLRHGECENDWMIMRTKTIRSMWYELKKKRGWFLSDLNCSHFNHNFKMRHTAASLWAGTLNISLKLMVIALEAILSLYQNRCYPVFSVDRHTYVEHSAESNSTGTYMHVEEGPPTTTSPTPSTPAPYMLFSSAPCWLGAAQSKVVRGTLQICRVRLIGTRKLDNLTIDKKALRSDFKVFIFYPTYVLRV
jgi:hypothetical protein